jgi:hypothetical protein
MFTRLALATALVGWLAGTAPAQQPVIVNGYWRSNGTYVQPYYRTRPDGNFYNNWSTYPNVNPYTFQQGTRYYPPPTYHYTPNYQPYYRRGW